MDERIYKNLDFHIIQMIPFRDRDVKVLSQCEATLARVPAEHWRRGMREHLTNTGHIAPEEIDFIDSISAFDDAISTHVCSMNYSMHTDNEPTNFGQVVIYRHASLNLEKLILRYPLFEAQKPLCTFLNTVLYENPLKTALNRLPALSYVELNDASVNFSDAFIVPLRGKGFDTEKCSVNALMEYIHTCYRTFMPCGSKGLGYECNRYSENSMHFAGTLYRVCTDIENLQLPPF